MQRIAVSFFAFAMLFSSVAMAGSMAQIASMQGAGPCVALTFDDGPHDVLTPKLLDILKDRGVKATFFVVGYRVKAWPQVVQRAHREGHEIGNHSWNHPALTSLGSSEVQRQISRTDAAIVTATGKAPRVLRVPYGSISQRVASLDSRPFIGWDVDTLDWLYRNIERITTVSVSGARGGSIVLLHDIHPRTVAAVPGIIEGLRGRGFRFVTVSKLIGGTCGGIARSFVIVKK